MRRKIARDPEQEAHWAENRRQLQARIGYHERLIRQAAERAILRRERLRRLTFGLLPR
jgi:hypothetical protein